MQTEKTRRILYIEDHADTRELVTLLLAQKSYEVITGSTIASGVSLATAEEFDLYLLDSWLPDGSGLDLCQQIRSFDKTTPILFYSAAAYAADHDLALQSGAQAYLVKPSHPSELCDMVTYLIDRSEHTRLERRSEHARRHVSAGFTRRPETSPDQS